MCLYRLVFYFWMTAWRQPTSLSLCRNHAAILIPDLKNTKKRFYIPFFSVGCRVKDVARGKNNKGEFLIDSFTISVQEQILRGWKKTCCFFLFLTKSKEIVMDEQRSECLNFVLLFLCVIWSLSVRGSSSI